MKSQNFHLFSKVLLLIAMFAFGCEKSSNTEQEREEISLEVRKSLVGEILFSKNNSIYKATAKSGGSGILMGTKVYESVRQKWSSDGSKIAYIKITELGNDCYLVISGKDGMIQHEWLLGTYSMLIGLRDITWSPDDYTIALLAGNKIIYITVASGNLNTTQLIPKPGFTFFSLAWWPKGSKIAISEGRESMFSSEDASQYIWMLEAYDKVANNLLIKISDPSVVSINYLDWSMDGTMLTYSGSGAGSIYIVNSDGTGNQKITAKYPFEGQAVYGFAPCWMSNNKQIIYAGMKGDWTTDLVLFVTDIQGTYNVHINIPGLYPDCY